MRASPPFHRWNSAAIRWLWVVAIVVVVVVWSPGMVVVAYRQCPKDQGGGICPDGATCCPTDTAGISACITARSKDPFDQGTCCSSSSSSRGHGPWTGCGFGYTCATITTTTAATTDEPHDTHQHLSEKESEYCQRQDNAPEDRLWDLPRYHLCSVSDHRMLTQVHGFPIPSSGSTSSPSSSTTNSHPSKARTRRSENRWQRETEEHSSSPQQPAAIRATGIMAQTRQPQ